jgi:hypothetical protein
MMGWSEEWRVFLLFVVVMMTVENRESVVSRHVLYLANGTVGLQVRD